MISPEASLARGMYQVIKALFFKIEPFFSELNGASEISIFKINISVTYIFQYQ